MLDERPEMLRKFVSPAWAVIEYVWYPLLLFVSTPWFLYRLGPEQYGHWMLLAATAGFGGVLTAGTGAATIKSISAGFGRKAIRDIECTVNTSLAVAVFGGAILALFVFLIFWFGASGILGRMGDPSLVRLTGTAAAAVIFIEQLDNVFSSSMKGAEFFGQAARVEIASKTTQILAAALILVWIPTLAALYFALLVVAVLRMLLKSAVTRRLLGLNGFRPSFTNTREILQFAKWGWLQGVGAVVFGVADRMLIGSLLGAASLTYYSIASQLAMQVHAVAAAGLSVIFPKVSRMLEDNNGLSLWWVTRLTMAANFCLSTSIALLLILLGPAILHLWIGAESAGPTGQLLPWLVVAYWILALNVVPYYVLLGMGRVRFVGLTILVSGVAAVIAMYLAISSWGLPGAPFGRGVYAVLSLALVWPLLRHFLAGRDDKFKMLPASTPPNTEVQ